MIARILAVALLLLAGWTGVAQTPASSKLNVKVERAVVTPELETRQVEDQAFDVVHYTTTTANVKYLFATAEPVLRLKSGDILDTNTLDCFGNGLKKPGDTLSMATGDNPLAGPFYVEGAEPGDTLAVKILDLQVDGNMGVGAFAPGFGAINETNYTPMLHAPLPERVWFYPIDHAANTATFKALDSDFSVKIPMHPFFGCIGVAPANGEARTFGGAGGVWREHGFSRGQRGQHGLFSSECKGRSALSGRWARGHGRRRNCRDSD